MTNVEKKSCGTDNSGSQRSTYRRSSTRLQHVYQRVRVQDLSQVIIAVPDRPWPLVEIQNLEFLREDLLLARSQKVFMHEQEPHIL